MGERGGGVKKKDEMVTCQMSQPTTVGTPRLPLGGPTTAATQRSTLSILREASRWWRWNPQRA
jgi:hypothetical protein